MKPSGEGDRRQDGPIIAVTNSVHVPQLKFSSVRDINLSSTKLPQFTRKLADGKSLSSLLRVHADTTQDLMKKGVITSQTTQSCFASLRVKSKRCKSCLSPRLPRLVSPTAADLYPTQLHTAHCFEALENWHQSMKVGVAKTHLARIQEVLHAAIYFPLDTNAGAKFNSFPFPSSASDSPVNRSIPSSETNMVEYFALVAEMQGMVKLQRQEHSRLTTQLAMENSIQQDLIAQLHGIEHDYAQIKLLHAYSRAEIQGEQHAVQDLEPNYASLTEHEQEMQRECELLELQLENQQAQLKKACSLQLNLEFTSSAPLKRQKEEKKWQNQHATVALQAQNAERENQDLKDAIQKLEDEALTLEAQYALDVDAKEKAEVALKAIQGYYTEFYDAYERTRACYTPRPDWNRIVDAMPELSGFKNTCEMLEGGKPQDLTDPFKHDSGIDKVGVLEYLDEENGKQQYIRGQTNSLVEEMLQWIQRLQKYCGATPYLIRLWHDVEEARVELNNLYYRLDRTVRKKSMLSTLNVLDAGPLAALASGSPLKTKQEYTRALGMHEGVPLFLRHCGKVKRKALKKIDIDKVVRKVWVEKRKREQRNPLRRLSLEQVLYEKLYRKYGFQPLIAEWGYNIILALQSFSWDPEIELFLLCLTGAVSDLVFSDQEQMIQKCLHLLLRLCDLSNVEIFVTERSVLLKDALVALRAFFPLKTSNQMQAIEKSIIRDMHTMNRGCNDPILYINDILPINAKYRRGYFVKTIRTQHFKEIQDYYTLLLSELNQRDAEHTGILPISAIQDTILAIDPLANPGKVHNLIKQALQIKTQGQLLRLREPVLYKAALRKLSATCLMKFTINFDQNAEVNWCSRSGVAHAVTSAARASSAGIDNHRSRTANHIVDP